MWRTCSAHPRHVSRQQSNRAEEGGERSRGRGRGREVGRPWMAVVPRRAMRTTTAPPLEAFSRTVELCNFGIGLVAGFLLVTGAYFSNTKFDAIHIAPLNCLAGGHRRLETPIRFGRVGAGRNIVHGGSKGEVLDTDSEDDRSNPSSA
ncbi:uncharacterized protein LOC119349371 isoform X3 [Triticum dicoccoides]|uniref:uncharacterized protein LOC119349371 isoform X3 n=1 Tax=Triticum dicoccoides TaxID=85692 RepID=UPI00188DF2C8|nr:uncharacterized protein LOC119349371 isoform X3 [Triticum dicoccoides]